jgi:hypothetical protein
MPVLQKPEYDVVQLASAIMNNTRVATQEDARRLAGRILDDQKNAPKPNALYPNPLVR